MLFLQTQDYEINGDGKLCITLNGFTLVFYTSDICSICEKLKPKFNKLSKSILGCTFAYMDVQQDNMKIRKLAAKAEFALDYVPIFVLYFNGIPIDIFNLNEKNPLFLDTFPDDLRVWLVDTTSYIINTKGKQPPKKSQLKQVQDQPPQKSRADIVNSIGKGKPSARQHVSYKAYSSAYSS